MSKAARTLSLFIVMLLASALLSGCFNMAEEFTFNTDGSGAFSLDIGMSEGLLAIAEAQNDSGSPLAAPGEMEQSFKDNPFVTQVKTSQTTENGYRHLT